MPVEGFLCVGLLVAILHSWIVEVVKDIFLISSYLRAAKSFPTAVSRQWPHLLVQQDCSSSGTWRASSSIRDSESTMLSLMSCTFSSVAACLALLMASKTTTIGSRYCFESYRSWILSRPKTLFQRLLRAPCTFALCSALISSSPTLLHCFIRASRDFSSSDTAYAQIF